MGTSSPAGAAGRVLLGLGATVDVEIAWDADVVAALAQELGILAEELDRASPITDERSLLVALLAALRSGRGDERFAESPDVVRSFAARFRARVTLGGTAVRAAIVMSLLGVPATVHMARIDPTVRRLLPVGTAVLHSGEAEALDPHLIIQFPRDTRIRLADATVVSPSANRFIVANDPPNRELPLAAELPSAFAAAHIVVLSTLNAIQDPNTMRARLSELERMSADAPADGIVVWEDAAYHEPDLRAMVAGRMARIADVYSMNEDELASFIGREVDLLDAADVADALGQLSSALGARTVVVHTRYWALARGGESQRYRTPLRSGIDVAGSRYVRGDALTAADVVAVRASEQRGDVLAFARDLEAIDPSIVCEPGYELRPERPTTIGLGDAFVGGFAAALARGDGAV